MVVIIVAAEAAPMATSQADPTGQTYETKSNYLGINFPLPNWLWSPQMRRNKVSPCAGEIEQKSFGFEARH